MCPLPFFLHGHTEILGMPLNSLTELSQFKADVCLYDSV